MNSLCRSPLFKELVGRICRSDLSKHYFLNGWTLVSRKRYCTQQTNVLKQFDNSLVDKYITFLSSTYNNHRPDFENYLEDYNFVQIQQICKTIANISKKNEDTIQLTNMLKEYAEDAEMKKLINIELETLQSEISTLKDGILIDLLNPQVKMKSGDVVFEVNAGAGGLESMLFAQEILQMYQNYFHYKGWQASVISQDGSELGGLRHATVLISGRDAYHTLQFEGGVHRVQRVPKTEKSGRLHTSTMTVVVLLQPNEVEVSLNPKDLKIETCRASGKGGQHVNTTDSAVRIVHLPTGLVAECQNERSQLKNKEIALKILRSRIFQVQQAKIQEDMKSNRLRQVSSANRNEKIRTYNFKDDRITDHRIAKSAYNLNSFFGGGEQLDDFIKHLRNEFKKEFLIEKMMDVK